ncbi:ATP-dependent DNA ligase [Paenibacillus alba]|uniref:RNA ligase family protein n=1 Tax=Paenibacillus alba TaxID=1197127 RepID=A0ABU6GC94_9BACL|nr:DNA ligase [Paenibacillus alba]MEC0231265.1 RNA ligase family protein [Paenibacillus alba]
MFIKPMLLQYAKDNLPFDHPDYIAELKLDGIRMIVSNIEELKLYTRHHNEVTAIYPDLLQACPVPKGTVLDGELIVTDDQGRPDFEACMTRFKSRKSTYSVQFCAFDIIYHRGIDVTAMTLTQRKQLLEEAFQETEYYKKVRVINGSAVTFFDLVKANGIEGIVLKKKSSRYEKGSRSWSMQKVIAYDQDEVVITGYSKKDFGWLIGKGDGEQIRPLGIMELGISGNHRKAMYPILKNSQVGESRDHVYVDPRIHCRVKHRGYYKSGLMRLPVLDEVLCLNGKM